MRDLETKERRQQGDRLVRTCLQILIQHSYVAVHLVRPESTRKNKAPLDFQVYTADVAAITRSIRCASGELSWYSCCSVEVPVYSPHTWCWGAGILVQQG